MGIAVSVLLHLLLIFGYRISITAGPAPAGPPAQAMTVWLRPAPLPVPLPPAKPKELPPPKAVAKVEPPRKKPKDEEKQAAQPSKPAPAAPLTPPGPAAVPQPITVPTPAGQQADLLHPEQQPKKFDMEAALKTARKVANEKDPARANLPVAQLDTHPLYPEQTEDKLSRDIKSATRPDCRNGGGGLLAPLIWLMDKKDSGCKW
jgi:hypothetical protein